VISHFTSPRARVHWIGYRRRRRRLERLVIVLLFLGAMVILQRQQFLLWSTFIGGATSIYITLYSLFIVLPRKQYHWI
jgi:hypothetical protein